MGSFVVAGSSAKASGTQRTPVHDGSDPPGTSQCTAGARQGVQRRTDRDQLRRQSVRR